MTPLSSVRVKMKHLLISISLIYLGIYSSHGHTISKFEVKHPADLIYKIAEDKDGKSLTITNPRPEKPTLREIIYFHLVEKAYNGDDGKTESPAEDPDFDDSRRPFTNGQGYQFFGYPETSTEKPSQPNNSSEYGSLIDKRKEAMDNDESSKQETAETTTEAASQETETAETTTETASQEPETDETTTTTEAASQETEAPPSKRVKREVKFEGVSKLKRFKRELKQTKVPFAPVLNKLDLKRLPKPARHLLTNAKTESGKHLLEAKEDGLPYLSNNLKTDSKLPDDKNYGMNLHGDAGVIWNKLRNPNYAHIVGNFLSHLADKEENIDSSSDSGSDDSNSSDVTSQEDLDSNKSPENSNEAAEDTTSNEASCSSNEDCSDSRSGSQESGSVENSGEDSGSSSDSGEDSGSNENSIEEEKDKYKSKKDFTSKLDEILNKLHNVFVENNSTINIEPGALGKPGNLNILDLIHNVFNSTKFSGKPGFVVQNDPKKPSLLTVLEGFFTNIIRNNIVINNNVPVVNGSDLISPEKDKSETNDQDKPVVTDTPDLSPKKEKTEDNGNKTTPANKDQSDVTDNSTPKPNIQPVDHDNTSASPESTTNATPSDTPNNTKTPNKDLDKTPEPNNLPADIDTEKPNNEVTQEPTTAPTDSANTLPAISKEHDADTDSPNNLPNEVTETPNSIEPLTISPTTIHDDAIKKHDDDNSSTPRASDADDHSTNTEESPKVIGKPGNMGQLPVNDSQSASNEKPDANKEPNASAPAEQKIDYMLDLINNEKFWNFMGDLAGKYLESLMARTSAFIKEEITFQMKEYLESLKKLEERIDTAAKKEEAIRRKEKDAKKQKDLDNNVETHKGNKTLKKNKEAIHVKANTLYGNTVGNDKVANIYIFMANHNSNDILKHIKQIANSNNSTKIFTFGPHDHKHQHFNQEDISGHPTDSSNEGPVTEAPKNPDKTGINTFDTATPFNVGQATAVTPVNDKTGPNTDDVTEPSVTDSTSEIGPEPNTGDNSAITSTDNTNNEASTTESVTANTDESTTDATNDINTEATTKSDFTHEPSTKPTSDISTPMYEPTTQPSSNDVTTLSTSDITTEPTTTKNNTESNDVTGDVTTSPISDVTTEAIGISSTMSTVEPTTELSNHGLSSNVTTVPTDLATITGTTPAPINGTNHITITPLSDITTVKIDDSTMSTETTTDSPDTTEPTNADSELTTTPNLNDDVTAKFSDVDSTTADGLSPNTQSTETTTDTTPEVSTLPAVTDNTEPSDASNKVDNATTETPNANSTQLEKKTGEKKDSSVEKTTGTNSTGVENLPADKHDDTKQPQVNSDATKSSSENKTHSSIEKPTNDTLVTNSEDSTDKSDNNNDKKDSLPSASSTEKSDEKTKSEQKGSEDNKDNATAENAEKANSANSNEKKDTSAGVEKKEESTVSPPS